MRRFTFFVPKPFLLEDVLGTLAFAGRPVVGYVAYPDGYDVSVAASAQQFPTLGQKCQSAGYTPGGRQSMREAPKELPPTDYEFLMRQPVKKINAFIESHKLSKDDYANMLEYEQNGKGRTSLLKRLERAIG